MTPPLATVADLADLPDAPTEQSVITAAGEFIRGSCDWHIAPVITETVVMSGSGHRVLNLPSLRVVSVVEVRELEDDVALTDWRLVGGGRLVYGGRASHRFTGGWPRGDYNIAVTLTHGYEAIPEDLKGAIIGLADSIGETPVGIRTETHKTGDRSDTVTYFAEGTYAGGGGMPPAIEAVLTRHRVS